MLGQSAWFTGKHTVFGRISSGLAVVDRIGRVQTDGDDRCAPGRSYWYSRALLSNHCLCRSLVYFGTAGPSPMS